MADNSILSRLDPRNVGKSVASLIGEEDTDPDPRGYSRSSTQLYSAEVDISRPDPQLEDYVTEYKNNPVISTPIENLAFEVWEPGWWIEADSEKTVDELTEFCHNIGIKAGKPHASLTQLGKQAVVQYQVRGNFMGEKITDEKDREVAINPLNPSTFEIYTKPGTNMLVPPDYETDGNDANIKETPSGETAAFVQFDQQFSRWEDRTERRFTRGGIMHWPRWPDIGNVFGQSVVESVYERSIAMREKMDDNDLAIAMKAWPMVLFQLGSEDHPWTQDEMEDFMEDYKAGELGPGMYQGVPGDVEVHEFAGETADIQEHVQTDVEHIISAMPTPKYALGAFEHASDGKSMAEIQERQFRKLVRAHRRDLENLFTPYLEDVAESWGYDTSGLELHIGRPDGEVAPEDVQGSIIRYTSDVSGNSGESQEGGPSIQDPETQDGEGPDGPSTEGTVENGQPTFEASESDSQTSSAQTGDRLTYDPAQLADPDANFPVLSDNSEVEELNDPRLVSTRDHEKSLGSDLAAVVRDARDTTLDVLEARYNSDLPEGRHVSSEFRATVGSDIRDDDLSNAVNDVLMDVLDRTVKKLSASYHSPQLGAVPRSEHLTLRDEIQNMVLRDLEIFTDNIATEIERQVENIDYSGRGPEAVSERVLDIYDDGTIERRTRLIARMRIQELINRTKLDEYRDHDEVAGVRVISVCSENMTPITSELAGCDGGDVPVALFDSSESIGEQFDDATSAEAPEGFEPLAGIPPYHFGDVSELAPVTTDEIDR